MTESTRAGHYINSRSGNVRGIASTQLAHPPAVATESNATPQPLTIEALYAAHFDFVWRSLKHLGVTDAAIDDAVQDTFVVAHRRLADFEHRSTPRTWLFGIALRVARDHRRSRGRRDRFLDAYSHQPERTVATPYEYSVRADAGRLLRNFLETLPDEQRAVFILADVEQMTAPEIADTLSVNLNTVYSRLRTARIAFNAAVATVASETRRHG